MSLGRDVEQSITGIDAERNLCCPLPIICFKADLNEVPGAPNEVIVSVNEVIIRVNDAIISVMRLSLE